MADRQTGIAELAKQVCAGIETPYLVTLACGACVIQVQTNSRDFFERLTVYFTPFLVDADHPDIQITALEMPCPDLQLKYLDWPREVGKVGRKDSYVDFADGRACRKVRSGMQYLLGADVQVIFGNCMKNDNQVINLVVSQYIGWMLKRNWALCHASGVAHRGQGMAIAAFSGGGKSTLAMHLMRRGLDFISNDRSLIALEKGQAVVRGVPKHPRINPGTVLHNPSLTSVIPSARQREIITLPAQEIWDLEEKYDALVDQIFGPGRFQLKASLSGFLILNWRRESNAPTRFQHIDIIERPDLLSAVMKPPGPFFAPEDGKGPFGNVSANKEDYIPVLSQSPVIEVTGRVDFEQATDFCIDFLT